MQMLNARGRGPKPDKMQSHADTFHNSKSDSSQTNLSACIQSDLHEAAAFLCMKRVEEAL